MIRFNLTCANDHTFDSWFRSGEDCDKLIKSKMVACTTCGDSDVRKALMAPKVSTSDAITAPSLRETDTDTDIAKLKKHVQENATDVGTDFSTEARAMHDGEKPDRAIYGQASLAETKELLSDGVPVMPLPFVPSKKTN
jgi:hypothetical protein